MARLLVPLLALVAGLLIVALLRDRKARHQQRLAGLRGTFLHGAPLGGFSPARGVTEVGGPDGALSFRMPSTWSGGFLDPATASFDCGSGRRLRLDLMTLERPLEGAQTLLESLGGLRPEPERSLEALSNGNVLLKCLDIRGRGPTEEIVYCWHLARLLPSRQAHMAVFALSVPAEQAGEVFVQADLALLDREIHAARFASA